MNHSEIAELHHRIELAEAEIVELRAALESMPANHCPARVSCARNAHRLERLLNLPPLTGHIPTT